MPATIEDLERRVALLESEQKGEAQLTRRAFEHIHEIRDDIALLRKHNGKMGDEVERLGTSMTRLEAGLAEVGTRMDRLEAGLGRVTAETQSFRDAMPSIVAEAMREVLRKNGKGGAE